MGKTRENTRENELSAAQKATFEKFKTLLKELAFAKFPSFLYIQREILGKIETSLCSLDDEYVGKHKIPINVVREMAEEVYDELMKKGEYDRAITVASHYKL